MASKVTTPKNVDRLDELIEQLHLNGCLPESELTELESILLADQNARAWFLLKQELHSMLGVDKTIRLGLASDLLPGKTTYVPEVKDEEPPLSRLEQVNRDQKKNSKQHLYRMMTSVVAMLIGLFGLLWILSISKKVTDAIASNGEEPKISYTKQIYPIFADNCLSCHGEDETEREADLRLDVEKSTIAGDNPVIIPGDPDGSELIARIRSADEEYQMPPAKTGVRLNGGQIELLKKWIAQGADY